MEEGKGCTDLSCKLTSAELQQRKATVIHTLRSLVQQRTELSNGFSYQFNGSDDVLDLLLDFVKTERQCCPFFSFSITVQSDTITYLTITGPEGAKAFITNELEF